MLAAQQIVRQIEAAQNVEADAADADDGDHAMVHQMIVDGAGAAWQEVLGSYWSHLPLTYVRGSDARARSEPRTSVSGNGD